MIEWREGIQGTFDYICLKTLVREGETCSSLSFEIFEAGAAGCRRWLFEEGRREKD